jgi:Tripartite tricarboxylate transporter family receptor
LNNHSARKPDAATRCSHRTAVAAPTAVSHAKANYPTRIVKLIVPYPPGGGTDLLARVLAQQLEQKWNQSVIVENVGGAGGNIGAEQVAQAAPDGYTLLLTAPGPLALNSLVYKTMPYDPAMGGDWPSGDLTIRADSESGLCRCQLDAGDRRRQSQSQRGYPRTAAQSSTASMRLRTRDAVSVLVAQIGSMHRRTRPVSMSAIGNRPITG